MKKILYSLTFFGILVGFQLLLLPTPAFAQTQYTYMEGCSSLNQCVDNKRCIVTTQIDANRAWVQPRGADCGSSQLGRVSLPDSFRIFNLRAALGSGQTQGIGLVVFLSSLIQLFVIICGIWSMFNFLHAGYIYISSSGDSKAHQEVKDKLTMTAVGLTVIAGAYMLAGLIGLLFFGDATFILNPKLTSALD